MGLFDRALASISEEKLRRRPPGERDEDKINGELSSTLLHIGIENERQFVLKNKINK